MGRNRTRMRQKAECAFHSTKNSGLPSEIFICRMERYFPLRRTDLVPFPLEHILLDKMLKDHGKVAVLNAVSCFIEINLTHTGIQNSSLIFT